MGAGLSGGVDPPVNLRRRLGSDSLERLGRVGAAAGGASPSSVSTKSSLRPPASNSNCSDFADSPLYFTDTVQNYGCHRRYRR